MRSSNSKGKVISNSIDSPIENGLSHAERLPTIQIDTVPSPPWSPNDLTPPSEHEEEPLETNHIDLQLEDEQNFDDPTAELRESLRSFVEDVLSQAMVVAEKKLKFVGLEDDSEEEEETAPQEAATASSAASEEEQQRQHEEEHNEEEEEQELRDAAERVVEEVLSKATEQVADHMEKETTELDFPIRFVEAPEDIKDMATNLIKEIVGKAIAMAEEKAVPTVPFNFEDVDLIKSSGPWYVRVREGFMRVLRTACFCTPRRGDS